MSLFAFAILAAVVVADLVGMFAQRLAMSDPNLLRIMFQTILLAIVIAVVFEPARKLNARVSEDLNSFQHGAAVRRARTLIRLRPQLRR